MDLQPALLSDESYRRRPQNARGSCGSQQTSRMVYELGRVLVVTDHTLALNPARNPWAEPGGKHSKAPAGGGHGDALHRRLLNNVSLNLKMSFQGH